MLQHRAVETHQRSLRLWSHVATAAQEAPKQPAPCRTAAVANSNAPSCWVAHLQQSATFVPWCFCLQSKAVTPTHPHLGLRQCIRGVTAEHRNLIRQSSWKSFRSWVPCSMPGEETLPNTVPFWSCTSADWSILVKQIERAILGTCCWFLNKKECATSTAITRLNTTNQPGWLEERIKLIPSRVALIHRLRFKAGIPEPTRPSPSLKFHQPESDSSHKYLKFFIKIIFISMKKQMFLKYLT